jgi:hypothetical protein
MHNPRKEPVLRFRRKRTVWFIVKKTRWYPARCGGIIEELFWKIRAKEYYFTKYPLLFRVITIYEIERFVHKCTKIVSYYRKNREPFYYFTQRYKWTLLSEAYRIDIADTHGHLCQLHLYEEKHTPENSIESLTQMLLLLVKNIVLSDL